MKKYDFLIVGAGIFGATCARLLTDKGYKCLILERNNHVGGLCHTETKNNITIHTHGPHIFYTDNKEVWDFVNKYDEFNNYQHRIIANNHDDIFHLPISMDLFNTLYDVTLPKEAAEILKTKINLNADNSIYDNLETYATNVLGKDLYELFIKEYNEKKWFQTCDKLPYTLISNFIMSYTYNTNYFAEQYQGIPKHGYTILIENIIGDDIDIMLNKDYLDNIDKYNNLAEGIIYTGAPDVLCKYKYGTLEWISMSYETIDMSKETNNVIGCSVMTFTDKSTPWTRIIEHKYFNPERSLDKEWNKHSFISYEYPTEWKLKMLPYYIKETKYSRDLYSKYADIINKTYPNMILGGRFGMYQNMSMSECIEIALKLCEQL